MRLLLVDEQRLFREGLSALLRAARNVEVVGHATSAREAYALVNRVHPDVVVMELVRPGVDGVTAAREIRRLRRQCKLVVLTGSKDRRLLQAAWLAGIDACLTKDESVETLLNAMTRVTAGHRFIGPSMRKTDSQLRIADDEPPYLGDPLARLSLRERVVFDLVVRGFTTKAVARELCISTKTVETHRAHINQKLAAHCTADLVRYAFQDRGPIAIAAPLKSERRNDTHAGVAPRTPTG